MASVRGALRRLARAVRALGGAATAPAKGLPEQQIKQLEGLVSGVLKRDYGGDLMPPAALRLNVGAKTSKANFWAQGASSSRRCLEIFGEAPEGPVLDWGCGSGRTLNWLKRYPAWRTHWHGCDVDPEAIGWLHKKGFAQAAVCSDAPVLPYADNTFVGLYAYSVLTHIPPEAHGAWYAEIKRVLAPGGRAYLTTQGEGIVVAGRVAADTTEIYQRTGAAWETREGHYKHVALVSERYTRGLIEPLFEVIEYKRDGYQNMDAFLVRKSPD